QTCGYDGSNDQDWTDRSRLHLGSPQAIAAGDQPARTPSITVQLRDATGSRTPSGPPEPARQRSTVEAEQRTAQRVWRRCVSERDQCEQSSHTLVGGGVRSNVD